MAALSFRDVSVTYPRSQYQALRNITVEIPEQQISILLGPNGSGKSTFLKAVLGLVPYEGTIAIFGESIDDHLLEIGYVPQRFSLDETLPVTVEEFLTLALVTCAHTRSEKDGLVLDALQKVNANQLLHKQLHNLSGGQLQRVLLARALVHEPHLLLLDEPEAGIDPGGEKVFYELLADLTSQTGITTVIASHELQLVRTYADHVICLNRTLVCAGKPESTLHPDQFDQLYEQPVQEFGHPHHHHD